MDLLTGFVIGRFTGSFAPSAAPMFIIRVID
jgi:hypothetical protein